jgi:peptide subunit release factor 1 (eRF1)
MNTETLRSLVSEPGPFASVWLDVSQDSEDAAAALVLRRRELRDRLTELGASPDLVRVVDEAIVDADPVVGRGGRVLIATEHRVLSAPTADPPPTVQARFSDLPYLLPVMQRVTAGVSHVLVVVDKTGADLKAVDQAGVVHQPEEPEAGADESLHEVRAGGWSHYSIQQEAEEDVSQSMKDVADAVAELTERIGARAVLVAGEEQARSGLTDVLPEHVADQTVELESGGRAAGTDPTALEAATRDVLERIAAEDHDAQLERFRVESGRSNGLAAQGLDSCVAALREADVELVFLSDELAADHPLWTATEPNIVALEKEDLLDLGAEPTEHRADEVLPVAAVSVGAQVVAVADEMALQDGIGVLRKHE